MSRGGGRAATARPSGRRGGGRRRGGRRTRCAPGGRRRAGRCGGTGTRRRGRRARTTGRTGSTRAPTRRGCRRDRSTSHASSPPDPTGGPQSSTWCRPSACCRAGRHDVLDRSGDGRVGVLLAGARDVLGPGRPVPVAQLVATGGVGVPAGRHRRAWWARCRRPACWRPASMRTSRRCRRRWTSTSWRPSPDASVPVDAGAVPHPAGSLTAGSSAGRRRRVRRLVAVDSRFRKAVMSLPAGTIATTSQPSPTSRRAWWRAMRPRSWRR